MKFKYFSKLAFLCAILIATANFASAQTARKPAAVRWITVVTEPRAAVWLDEVRRGTTDESGQLKIDRLGAGAKKLRIRAVGFAEKTQTVTPAQRGDLSIALTATSDKAEIAFQEAEFLRESGKAADREKAIELYRRALELRPRFAAAHVGLARIYEEGKEFEAALEEVAKARKINPNSAEASVVEGRVYRAESYGEYDNAVKAFRRAIREAKGFQPEAHTGLAMALKEQGENAAAVAEFKIALVQLADSEPVIYQILGETYEAMKANKEAIAAYEKFLQIAPDHAYASSVRSIIVQLKKKKNDGTLELMPQ